MGKKSRLKKQRQEKTAPKLPPKISPELIEAYTRGRAVGEKEGRTDGAAEVMILFNGWLQEIDQHVKGIGPKKKLELEKYFANRLRETVAGNKLKSAQMTIVKDIPKASNN